MPEKTVPDLALLRQTLSESDNSLLMQLGEKDYVGFTPPPPAILLTRGSEWLQSRTDELKAAICASSTVRSLADGDVFALAQAIWIVIAAHFNQDTTIATVSTLLARQGVKLLCADFWNTK